MVEGMELSGSDIETFRAKAAVAIQESYELAAHRFGRGFVHPQFILGFYDGAADSVAAEAVKFFQEHAEELCQKHFECGPGSAAYGLANYSSEHSEIVLLGLREQITDNVQALMPLLKGYYRGANDAVFWLNTEVHIVTIGQEPAVRACVFSSGTSPPKKLIHSAESSDAISALKSLLKKTQSMLATQFGVNSRVTSKASSSMSTKVGSAAPSSLSSTTTKVGSTKSSSRTAPTCEAPVTQVTAAEVKYEAKGKHARDKSIIGFWDSDTIHNPSFHENCGEPTSDGEDSGFLSRDGEAHPNRSYNDLQALANVPASIQHARFMTEVTTPEIAPKVPEKKNEVLPKVVEAEIESDKFF